MLSTEPSIDYAGRRGRVLEALGGDAALVLGASPEVRVGRDLELRYRPDPDLYYLTGYAEPDTVAVLCPAHEEAPVTLFIRERDAGAERWTGPRPDVEAARERSGADVVHALGELDKRLVGVLRKVSTVYAPIDAGHTQLERRLRDIMGRARLLRQRSGRGPRQFADPGVILDPMRLIKEPAELALLRRAAGISIAGVREAVTAIRPGAGEWEVEAVLDAAFRRQGAAGSAFAPIIAAGERATTLHYIENAGTLAAGELLLIDAGASYRMYAGDVSRTLPISGRFTPIQRDVYDAVLAARDAGIAAVRPGATVDDVHHAALRVLLQALLDLRVVQGDVDTLLEREDDYKPFYPHRTSHWIGLDVHDVGEYGIGGQSRPLAPGMVLTVEPGLYFPPPDPAAPLSTPDHLRGIGVRIEDTVAVTADGNDVLTADLPAEPTAVEDWIRTAHE